MTDLNFRILLIASAAVLVLAGIDVIRLIRTRNSVPEKKMSQQP